MTETIRSTRSGAYVELTPPTETIRATRSGAYVELVRDAGIRTTRSGAYIELASVFESGTPTAYAHAFSPYGIRVSATYAGGLNDHFGFTWQYSLDGVSGWTTFATTNSTTLFATHFPLSPTSSYYYRVFAFKYAAGTISNVVTATTLEERSSTDVARLWIDVYDSNNTLLGPGPLTEIVSWRNVRRLSRAGEFSVQFPATYLRLHEIQSDGAALLANDRYFHCYGILDGAVTLLGAGWVKKIELRHEGGAPPTIVGSGPDLLGELRKATVFSGTKPWQHSIENSTDAPDALVTTFAVTPAMPANWTITGGSTTGTSVTAKFVHATILGALIDVGTKISEHFRAGTTNNGRNIVWIGPRSSFSDSGVRAELHVDPVAAESHGEICLLTRIAEVEDSWDLNTKVFPFGAGQGHDRLDLAAVTHWPDGDRLRSDIVSISGDGTTISITTSQAHELSVAESVKVDGTDNYDGTYTVATVPTSTTLTCLSATTGATSTGFIYGSFLHTLDSESYYCDLTENSLENQTARTSHGRHSKAVQFKEVSPISNSDADVSEAANSLLKASYAWLRERSTPAFFYRLSVAKLTLLLLPGQTIRVVARGFVDDEQYVNIDRDLSILETTTQINAAGVRTTDLMVSTVERWPTTSEEQAAQEFHQSSVYQSLAQLAPSIDTVSYREHVDDDKGPTLYFFLGDETTVVNQVVVRFRTDKLRSTVKSVGGESATTSSGGGSTPTSTSGGASTPTSTSGGASTPTSTSGGASTPTTTSYAPVTNHSHALNVTDQSPEVGHQLYYDETVGLNANLGADDVGGSTNLVTLPLTHDHDVTIAAHTHDVTIAAHTHDVSIAGHTHDVTIANHDHSVTASVSTVYGIYEDPGTAYGPTDIEFSVNSGAWRSDYTAISGASGWYLLDITDEVAGVASRPLFAANSIEARVKSASQAGNRAQITVQIERRVVIQSISTL